MTRLFLWRDRRSPAELGLDFRWRRAVELAAGWCGGAMLVLAMALLVRAFLPFPWVLNPAFDSHMAAWSFAWLVCFNAVEELIFRGYSFERLIAGIGLWQAQFVTALLFALFHVLSGWPWMVAVLGTTAGSLLFGFVFIRWRSVPAAAGVHAAANWTRDLLLLDPPTAKTLFAPLAPRPWTPDEQLALGSVALWISIRRTRRAAEPSPP